MPLVICYGYNQKRIVKMIHTFIYFEQYRSLYCTETFLQPMHSRAQTFALTVIEQRRRNRGFSLFHLFSSWLEIRCISQREARVINALQLRVFVQSTNAKLATDA